MQIRTDAKIDAPNRGGARSWGINEAFTFATNQVKVVRSAECCLRLRTSSVVVLRK